MSKLLSSWFGNSSKKNKSKEKLKTNSEIIENNKYKNHQDHIEDLPVMARKMSLTKSGRMKEKKRTNIAVSDLFPQENSDQVLHCDSDCNADEVIEEIRQIAKGEIKRH